MRVVKKLEAEATRILNPSEAEIQGPSLGLETNSSWVVRGIPGHVTKNQITTAFAQQNGEGWPGWLIRPKKTLSKDKTGKVAWLVDAAHEPPLRAITINKTLITVEMFFEKTGMAWKGIPGIQKLKKETPEFLPGDMYEKEYGSTAGEDQEQAKNFDPMQVDTIKADAAEDNTTEKGSASTDISMEEKSTQEDTKKRKLPNDSEGNATVGAMQQMMQFMQTQSEAKDKQIETLTLTIQGLQAQIQNLQNLMATMQLPAKEEKVDT